MNDDTRLDDYMQEHVFRADNTAGYSADDLANLNARFYEWCVIRDLNPVTGDKSLLDHIRERILAEYDYYLSITPR